MPNTIISINSFFPIWKYQNYYEKILLLDFSFCCRGYNDLKISKNVECEIFQSILEEALESYDSKIVQELHNNDTNDMGSNIKTVVDRISEWNKNTGKHH